MNQYLFIEFKRKAILLLALIIPIGLYCFPIKIAMALLTSVTLASVLVEVMRFKIPAIQRFFIRFLIGRSTTQR